MDIWAVFQLLKDNDVTIVDKGSKDTIPGTTDRYSLIKVLDLGKLFGIANAAQYFRNLARGDREERFIEFINQEVGRPAMYIAEPLFYEFLMTSRNPICIQAQKWANDTVLHQLFNDGIYTKEIG